MASQGFVSALFVIGVVIVVVVVLSYFAKK
jgi:hypothetical protein